MATKEKENTLQKTFDHILISTMGTGPNFSLGGVTYNFKPKVPVTAIIKLVRNENNYDGMTDYIIESLVDQGDGAKFRDHLSDIDGEGLAEIVEWLTESAAGFQSDTPAA